MNREGKGREAVCNAMLDVLGGRIDRQTAIKTWKYRMQVGVCRGSWVPRTACLGNWGVDQLWRNTYLLIFYHLV